MSRERENKEGRGLGGNSVKPKEVYCQKKKIDNDNPIMGGQPLLQPLLMPSYPKMPR